MDRGFRGSIDEVSVLVGIEEGEHLSHVGVLEAGECSSLLPVNYYCTSHLLLGLSIITLV